MENILVSFIENTGFYYLTYKHFIMLLIAFFFLYLGIFKKYEPLLLVPISFGMVIGNIPSPASMSLGVYSEGSVLYYLYQGVSQGVYPPLIFIGIGAMADFSYILSRPILILLGAAAQAGIFITFIGAYFLGFSPSESAAIGIIGGADGPTAIFLTSKLAPELIGPIAVAAYSYMALVPVIQPPIMKLLTSKKERMIVMRSDFREISKKEKVIFPVGALVLCCLIAPGALPLLGMLFLGNILKEAEVTNRLAEAAKGPLIDIVTILLGISVGASTQADVFLTGKSVLIFVLGVISFAVATMCGILFAKLMNMFLKEKINPLIGAAGVSAVPDSARVAQLVASKENPGNYILMHAMAPNISGVIGSAIAAGVMWSLIGKF
ncbi:MAG: sodium ion-translocating decarboxylase subunit beta [Desulforegulaceae bacterium]|nr:sodium ion-translocating decarboxylase subunit beta [Desulforegulaceae bacterium]